MENLLLNTGSGQWSENLAFFQRLEVRETDTHLLFSLELPGVSPETIKVAIDGNQLVVAGERKLENREDKSGRRLNESYYGSFQRAFSLPAGVNPAAIEAGLEDGVLRLAIPKVAPEAKRQIPVQNGKPAIFSYADSDAEDEPDDCIEKTAKEKI